MTDFLPRFLQHIMNSCSNREKVLLNLKWFVHRFLKSFETKLIQSVSCTPNSAIQSPAGISNTSSPTLSVLKLNTESNNSNNGLPLIRQLLEQQINGDQKRNGKDSNSYSNCDITGQSIEQRVNDRSPRLKIRSLTNSPLFRRLSQTINQNKRASLLASGEKDDFSNSDYTDYNEDFESCETKSKNKGMIFKRKCFSNTQSPNSSIFARGITGRQRSFLVQLFEDTTETQRMSYLSSFAQQLCIVYEYQLGMLRNLSSIHAAADYVADVIIKAVKLGKLNGINLKSLTPVVLFDNDCRPSSSARIIKTSPLAVTGEQLSWRLGEMWTLPGLRHNEVGGENCHNLSIVTHFLSTVTPNGEFSRSDLYGYRNLILLKHDYCCAPNNYSDGTFKVDDHAGNDFSNLIFSGPSFTEKMNSFFTISACDYTTISNSKIKPGNIPDTFQSNDSLKNLDHDNNEISDNSNNLNKTSPESKVKSPVKRTQNSSSAAMLRQHLHRAYRPVFFLIYNRPSVIEHLTECDSFATFCKRQSLSPVMFLNQPTKIFDQKPYPCIYQNFDLFKVSVAGYIPNIDNDNTEITAQKHDSINSTNLVTNFTNNPSKGSMYFPYFSRRTLAAYDNPGFSR